MQFPWRRTKKVGRGDWRTTTSGSSEFELSEDTQTMHESRGVLKVLQVSLRFGPKTSWRRLVSFVHCSDPFQLTRLRCGEVSLSVDNSFAYVHGPSMAECVWPWITETGEYDRRVMQRNDWLEIETTRLRRTREGRGIKSCTHHTPDSNLNFMPRERHNFSSCVFNDNARHMGVGMCSDVLISDVYSLQRCVGDSFAQDSNMILHLTIWRNVD